MIPPPFLSKVSFADSEAHERRVVRGQLLNRPRPLHRAEILQRPDVTRVGRRLQAEGAQLNLD